ncbi:hypothetical protein NHF46_12030 [Arthrobacter alpinus]|nr:hypothetical protein [Arthrobacter alpinus]
MRSLPLPEPLPDIRRGAVLGHPIGHSQSPAMHNAAYTVLGAPFAYTAYDLQVPQLAAFLDQVRAHGSWFGLSVTMPLKNAAVDLMDTLTPVAAALGAVNTIVITTDDAGHAHLLGTTPTWLGSITLCATQAWGAAPGSHLGWRWDRGLSHCRTGASSSRGDHGVCP